MSPEIGVPPWSCHAPHCRVYLCARVWENPLTGEVLSIHAGSGGGGSHDSDQIIKAPNLQEFHADGSITQADGSRIADVDACVFCTGVWHS